jgi:hypothetical protein
MRLRTHPLSQVVLMISSKQRGFAQKVTQPAKQA